MKRLLTIGHSYVVAANRQLAHHMALQGRDEWDVTAVAPRRFRGDLRHIDIEPIAGEACALRAVPVRLDRVPHLMWYGGDVRDILARKWDVVHCWEEPYTRSAARIARVVPAATKLIVASFQNISKQYPWPLRAYERETMSRANGWIAFGETVRDTLKERAGYADTPCRVIPPGVDLARFHPDPKMRRAIRERLGWPPDGVVVGYLGRFVDEKGIETLAAAADGPLRDGRCRVLFVGGGDREGRLREFAARHPGRVQVQTGVPHDEVPAWLAAMDVLCAPTRSTSHWREQFGRMLIEAMACGVALVASDSGEMPFVVADAGAIVGEDDTEGWARAIRDMIEDEPARLAYADRGIARAHEHYGWPLVARQHLAFFDEVVRG
jgi:glycosyltransferase involved in cell wall biosynthesis